MKLLKRILAVALLCLAALAIILLIILFNDITCKSSGYKVLEINSAPGLDNYLYAKNEQEEYVEELYTKVLDALMK